MAIGTLDALVLNERIVAAGETAIARPQRPSPLLCPGTRRHWFRSCVPLPRGL
jgi:hypothetical protein